MYHYRVIAAPGMIMVYGDVGDGMAQNHDEDMVGWLVKGAINSPDYVISKFTNRPKQFFPDEAINLLEQPIIDAEKTGDDDDRVEAESFRDKVMELWDREYGHGHDFGKAFYEAGGEAECIDSAYDYEAGVYWTFECLKKFVELYNELRSKDSDEEGSSSSYVAIT